MKRCHRLMGVSADPYLEFNFERSLRKYEKTHNKRLKTENSCLHASRVCAQSSCDHSPDPRTALVVAEREVKCEAVEGEKQVALVEYNRIEVQEQTFSVEAVGETVEKEAETHSKEAIAPLEQDAEGKALSSEAVCGLAEQSLPEKDKPASASLLARASSIEPIEASEQQGHPPSNPSSPFIPSCESVGSSSGGRFHLSDKIYISQRWLERVGREQGEGVVEELLRKREYLASERTEIASRLREFMGL